MIVVTGGAGFIGSNLVIKLVEEGYDVTVFDNFATGKLENLKTVKNKIKLIKGDVRDFGIVKRALKGSDFVFHQAALPSVVRSVKDPITTNEVNVKGTLNILLAARDCGVKRVIYASSSSVYGESESPKKEDMLTAPISPYAVAKLAGELYCKAFYNIYGLETIALRYFNVYGPRQDPSSEYAAVIPKFINLMLKDRQPIIYGDGNQTRDFTFVDDVVEANILAMKAKKGIGETFNIAYGKQTSINKLVEILNKILAKRIKAAYSGQRKGDIRHSLADISKARTVLGYRPKYDIESGLKRTIEWYKSNI
jgi:UDP-glucose 4-epimerase